jgi:hypothetical protein
MDEPDEGRERDADGPTGTDAGDLPDGSGDGDGDGEDTPSGADEATDADTAGVSVASVPLRTARRDRSVEPLGSADTAGCNVVRGCHRTLSMKLISSISTVNTPVRRCANLAARVLSDSNNVYRTPLNI